LLEFFQSFHLSGNDWFWIILCALCVGMGKVGLSGLGMFIVPVLASVFGAKPSTGILLPMLIMGDIMGVVYYHRHADLKLLLKLAPATVVGILIGVYVGDLINSDQFRTLLAVIILSGVVIMVWNERKNAAKAIPHNWFFASFAGLLGGFTTMIGNAAGPVMTIYFLSMNLKKNNFIGTSAWFFLLVNVFKVPFHILNWETITTRTFLFDLSLLPVIILGAVVGIFIVRLIPERPYRIFIIISIVFAAVKLFV